MTFTRQSDDHFASALSEVIPSSPFLSLIFSRLFIKKLFAPLIGQVYAYRLIFQTATQAWPILIVNVMTSLVCAFSEGLTLGVIFLAVRALSQDENVSYNWNEIMPVNLVSGLAAWLNGLPGTHLFLLLLALSVTIQVVYAFSDYMFNVSSGLFAARCRVLVTSRIHSQILSLSFPYASSYKIGDLNNYALNGPDAMRVQLEQISSLFVGTVLCLAYIIVLLKISPFLLVAVFVLVAIIVFIQKWLIPRIQLGSQNITKIQVQINSNIIDNFQGLRLLHSTGQLDAADKRVRAAMSELETSLAAQAFRMPLIKSVTSLFPILTISLIAAFATILLGDRSSGILPSLVTFVLALQKLTGRVGILAANVNMMAHNSGDFQRLSDILSPNWKEFRKKGGKLYGPFKKAIAFKDVCLQYSPEMPFALKQISFVIPKGRVIALVGSSGSGKSSIADLLTGLYTPSSGCILIDTIPLSDICLSSWQARIGVVSQDTFLFNASISENIAFGLPSATTTQIVSACKTAQASDFIEALPEGYDTMVGERGFRLSGGQRQRLSLARAILRNPDLLILDEATSALDSHNERLLQEAILSYDHNYTVLVIAHRLSTIVDADEILVMKNGCIDQRGSHTTLLNEEGTYRSLWSMQESVGLRSF